MTLNSYKGIRSSRPPIPCLIFHHRIHFSLRITCSIINDTEAISLNQNPSKMPKVMPKKYSFPIPHLKPDKLSCFIHQFKKCSPTPGTFLWDFYSPKALAFEKICMNPSHPKRSNISKQAPNVFHCSSSIPTCNSLQSQPSLSFR